MATISYYLHNKADSQGMHSIYYRYSHAGPYFGKKLVKKSTGIRIRKAHWLAKSQQISSKCPYYVAYNEHLRDFKFRVIGIAMKIAGKGEIPTPDKVLSQLQEDRNSKSMGFWDYVDKFVTNKLALHSPGTKKNYKNTFYSLERWERYTGVKITFELLTEDTINEFTSYLQHVAENKDQTIAGKLKNLKAFLGYGFNNNWHSNRSYLLIKPSWSSTNESIYLTPEEILQLYQFPYPSDENRRVADCMVYLCNTGMRYSELITSSIDLLEDGLLTIVDKKKDSLRVMPINDTAKEILQKYREMPRMSGPAFNRQLKRIAKLAGISELVHHSNRLRPKYELIVSHTGRRSFVTNYLAMGVPPATVGKWTGQTLNTIMGYNRQEVAETASYVSDFSVSESSG